MKHAAMAALVLVLLLSGCGGPSEQRRITVFAAASLKEAFEDLSAAFEAAHPDVDVQLNFGGSQQLAQQLAQGAPADVFAAASTRQMESVVQAGRIESGAQRAFARNQLAIIYPADNPANIRSLADLARPGVKIDLADAAVPAGEYTINLLEQAGADPALGPEFKAQVLRNVVSYEENVRAVVSKVTLGEVDAGIVYVSDIGAGENIGSLQIPQQFNVEALYPIAPLHNSAQQEMAQQFVDFVLSPQGQTILQHHGFMPAGRP